MELEQWARLELGRAVLILMLDTCVKGSANAEAINAALRWLLTTVKEWQDFYLTWLADSDGNQLMDFDTTLPFPASLYPAIKALEYNKPRSASVLGKRTLDASASNKSSIELTWGTLALEVANRSLLHASGAVDSWMQRFYLGWALTPAEVGKSFTLMIKS